MAGVSDPSINQIQDRMDPWGWDPKVWLWAEASLSRKKVECPSSSACSAGRLML